MDGVQNIFEHAFVLDHLSQDSYQMLPLVHSEMKEHGEFIQMTYRQRAGGTGTIGTNYNAGGITYRMETSSTLQPDSWESGTSLFRIVGNPIDNGDGSETVTVEFTFPLGSTSRFIRLRLITEQ